MNEIEIIGLISAIVTILSIVTWSKEHWARALVLFLLLIVAYGASAYVFSLWPFEILVPHLELGEEFLIKESSVGDFYLGMKYSDAISVVDNNDRVEGVFHQGTPESSDVPCFLVKDKIGNKEIYVGSNGKNRVDIILVLSEKYRTPNSIYPRMKIRDFLKVYTNMPLFMTEGMYVEEVFLPQKPRVSFVVASQWFKNKSTDPESIGKYNFSDYGKSNSRLSGYEYLLGDDINNLQNVTEDYPIDGEIIYISLGR